MYEVWRLGVRLEGSHKTAKAAQLFVEGVVGREIKWYESPLGEWTSQTFVWTIREVKT